MTTVQFISASPGCGLAGQKMKNTTNRQNASATMLTAIPMFPRLNLLGGNISFRSFFRRTQAITTMYELKIPATVMETRMLKARVLPMVMRATKQEMRNVRAIALVGTPETGWTLERKMWKGRPLSLAKPKSCGNSRCQFGSGG